MEVGDVLSEASKERGGTDVLKDPEDRSKEGTKDNTIREKETLERDRRIIEKINYYKQQNLENNRSKKY